MDVVPLYLMLIVTHCSMMSRAMEAKTYEILTDSNGRQLCSIDRPTTVITLAASTMAGQCGVQCTTSSACQLYQFKDDLAKCELFDNEPDDFEIVDKCTAYVSTNSK